MQRAGWGGGTGVCSWFCHEHTMTYGGMLQVLYRKTSCNTRAPASGTAGVLQSLLEIIGRQQ